MKWFEDERFWRDFSPMMFSEERFLQAEHEVQDILRMAPQTPKAVLDLCCGPGRHSIAFARLGFKVTGVDLSSYLLSRATERAAAAGAAVEFLKDDMRTFRRPEAYDLICSLATSFGYFEVEEDNFKVVQNVRRSLAANGTFIIDVVSKEAFARSWQDAFCTQFGEDVMIIQKAKFYDDCSRLRNEWILLRDGTYRSFTYAHKIYSGYELKELLYRAGFTEVQLFGNFDRRPYDIDAKRLIAVARTEP